MKTKDDYDKMTKVELQKEVFKVMNIKNESKDNSEGTPSGGGSNTTREAWLKVLDKLSENKKTLESIIQ